MRVGISLPHYVVDVAPGRDVLACVLETACQAEALGLDGVWVSDHPFAVAPDGTVSGSLEPLVLLGALAGATDRIRLGTLVLAATMRPPSLLAHTLGTLSRAAPGRIVAGIGAGWYEPEHRAFGVPLPAYDTRIAMIGSALDAIDGLGPARPDVLLGGSGDRLLRIASERADAWNVSWDVPTERFAALSRRLDDHCERAGRDPRSIARSVGLTLLVAEDERGLDAAVERLRGRAAFLAGLERRALEEKIICGTPRECAERIAAYGADEVVVALLLRDDPSMLELFGSQVAPLLRD